MLLLGGLAVGVHLMALLAGPAVAAVLLAETLGRPLADRVARDRERAQVAVFSLGWLLLVGLGLGSDVLLAAAAAGLVGCAMWVISKRQMAFLAWALLLVAIGITPYLFLLIRARQGPWLNEADPATWRALVAVIRRAQYPVRTPFDDPTVRHGAGNLGRSLTIFGYQLANYGQYFDWQWARTVGPAFRASPFRVAVTVMIALLGLRGAVAQRDSDRSGFRLLAALFLIDGPGAGALHEFQARSGHRVAALAGSGATRSA